MRQHMGCHEKEKESLIGWNNTRWVARITHSSWQSHPGRVETKALLHTWKETPIVFSVSQSCD